MSDAVAALRLQDALRECQQHAYFMRYALSPLAPRLPLNAEQLRSFDAETVQDLIPQPNPDWRGNAPDSATSAAPYRLYNIGNNQPVELMRHVEVLEQCLGRTAEKSLLPLQPGDVPDTYADVDDLVRDIDEKPGTSVEDGIAHSVDWYKVSYHTRRPQSRLPNAAQSR